MIKMEISIEEKRTSARIPCNRPANYMVIGSSSRVVEFQGKILDISKGGLRIQDDGHPLEPGTALRLQFPLYTKSISRSQIIIPILAEVRWVRKVATKVCEIGVRFMV